MDQTALVTFVNFCAPPRSLLLAFDVPRRKDLSGWGCLSSCP